MDRKAAALRASGSGRRRGSGFAGKKKAVMVKTGTGACRRHPQPARANTDMPPAPMGAGGREGEKCLRVQRGGSRDAKAQRVCEGMGPPTVRDRSEEHTAELQSRPPLVCRLLLEKKKEATGSSNYGAS